MRDLHNRLVVTTKTLVREDELTRERIDALEKRVGALERVAAKSVKIFTAAQGRLDLHIERIEAIEKRLGLIERWMERRP